MDKKTDFGFESLALQDKTDKVSSLFQNVAPHYDLMNDIMSLGLHRFWKKYFLSQLALSPQQKILDIAGGTGDIAESIFMQCQQEYLNSSVVLTDINPTMLKKGAQRWVDKGYITGPQRIEANAETLPFPNNHFDICTIAFGLRNITHKEKALEEIYRVLKPGGQFLCLEFSHPPSPSVAALYDLYSFTCIPLLGKVFAKNKKAYQYLVESIRMFPKADILKDIIQDIGFKRVSYETLTFGIVCIHKGWKK